MIIGLLANAGAGKDTVADYLIKERGFSKIAFADPLKRTCKEFFDFTDEQLWGPSECRNAPDKRYLRMTQAEFKEQLRYWAEVVVDKSSYSPSAHEYMNISIDDYNYMLKTEDNLFLTPRHALQQLGTEFGRSCYKNVWVDYAIRKIKGMQSIQQNVVISDVRFKSEVIALQNFAAVVKIDRPNLTVNFSHASEKDQATINPSLINYTINNNGTIEDLYKKIEHMLRTVSIFEHNSKE